MLRKVLCAGFVAAVIVSLAAADEFRAMIRSVEGGKVTFFKFKKGDDGKFAKGAEETLPAASNVKVVTGKFNRDTKSVEAGDALEGGLQNARFKNIEKGVPAHIVTTDGKISEIRIFQGRKKKE
jgi:hypothetical protein